MKTFVKVDKRLKKGVKSHGIWASHINQGRFFARFFYSSRETLWRSSASKSRGFWRYTFLVKQCVCQHPLKSSLIIGHSLYFSSSLSACAASCSSAAGTLAVARARSKNTPFESGIDSVGSARLRLSAKFYLVAMFFVIFDVEALYLYAWSTSIRESGWVGFVEAAIFILVLLAGLVYLVRIGALDWTPARSRRTLVNPETDSPTNRHMQ